MLGGGREDNTFSNIWRVLQVLPLTETCCLLSVMIKVATNDLKYDTID